jgi:hypothetical protein
MNENTQCVCCNNEADGWLPTNVFHQESPGEWWCEDCIEKCVPTHQAIDSGDYSIEENE